MPREHLGRRRAERHTVDVPSPLTDRRPHPDRTDRGGHPVGMRHGARFDGARDAVGDGLDRPERGRQLVVVAGVGGVHRHRPAEDRLLRVDRVGDARVHQPIARQVLMGVHVAGCHQRRPHHRSPRAPGCTARSSSHGPTSTMTSPRTATAAIAHHRAGVVHRHHVATAHEHVRTQLATRAQLLRRAPSREVATPCPTSALTAHVRRADVLCANPALRDAWYAVARSIDVGGAPGGGHAARHATSCCTAPATARSSPRPTGARTARRRCRSGTIEDGCLVCSYHGWTFGDDGRCVRVPSAAEHVPPPPRAHLVHVRLRRALRPGLGVPRQHAGRRTRRHPGHRPRATIRRSAASTPRSTCGRRRRRG